MALSTGIRALPLIFTCQNNTEQRSVPVLDETVVRLRDYATAEFDNEYDASKLFSAGTQTSHRFIHKLK